MRLDDVARSGDVEDRRRKRWYKDNPKRTKTGDLGEDDDVVADRIERRNKQLEDDPAEAAAEDKANEIRAAFEESSLRDEKRSSRDRRAAAGNDSETSTEDAVIGRRNAKAKKAKDAAVKEAGEISQDISKGDANKSRAERWYEDDDEGDD